MCATKCVITKLPARAQATRQQLEKAAIGKGSNWKRQQLEKAAIGKGSNWKRQQLEKQRQLLWTMKDKCNKIHKHFSDLLDGAKWGASEEVSLMVKCQAILGRLSPIKGFESCMKGFSCMEGFSWTNHARKVRIMHERVFIHESCTKGFSCMEGFSCMRGFSWTNHARKVRIMHERVFIHESCTKGFSCMEGFSCMRGFSWTNHARKGFHEGSSI